MDKSKEIFEITKKKFGLRFDRELGDLLGMKKSTLSQRIGRGDYPFFKVRQLLAEKGLASDWLDSYEKEMNRTDSTNTLHSEVQLLKEKERTINIQQSYIERLEKTIERLEEDKKKWIPAIAPELINQSNNWVNP
jgi:transcriptional regulator with XRE-family HTH domain